MRLLSRDLNRRVRIERETPATGFMSAGQGTWSEVATVWAQVQDYLPRKAENATGGVVVALRPTRIRIRYRSDITPDMRVIFEGRTLQIIVGPAELGMHEGLEIVAQDYSTQGNQA